MADLDPAHRAHHMPAEIAISYLIGSRKRLVVAWRGAVGVRQAKARRGPARPGMARDRMVNGRGALAGRLSRFKGGCPWPFSMVFLVVPMGARPLPRRIR